MKKEFKDQVRFKIIALSFMFVLLAGVVIIRLLFLQVVNYELFSNKAERQYKRTIYLPPNRGIIYDRNLQELAVNVDIHSIYAIPTEVHDPNRLSYELSKLLRLDQRLISKKLKSGQPFVWIKRKVDPDLTKKIEKLNLKGIGFIKESKRFYPKRNIGSQVIGFAGMDNQGLEGLELRYDEYIKEEPRWLITQKDALGRNVLIQDLRDSSKANNIVLTIDETIQYIAQKELNSVVESTKAKGGAILIMDPNTGDILAMADYPSFNPNSFNRYGSLMWRNQSITDGFEPGSTFKIFLGAAALEENLFNPNDLVYCENGEIRIEDHIIHDTNKYGWLSFAQILEKSSNVGAIKIGLSLGKEKLYKYIKAFGFGDKTNIDLPGESCGIVREPKEWSGISIGAVSIGQEISVTPLQLITAVSAVANGGCLLRPRVVKQIIDSSGRIIEEFPPVKVRRVISKENSLKLNKMLEEVISRGTGTNAQVEGYEVAGKTGTAQKIDFSTNSYSKDKFISSFVGYLPAKKPEIVVLVMIDEPKDVFWGGTIAAPVFKKVAEQVLRYLNVPSSDAQQVCWING